MVDDSGEYVASRFHVEGASTGDNSDLTSFESSLTDNVNAENEKVNEVYAVVAEKIADDADLTGGILSSAYAVRYLKTNYDLANRMYYKRAFDAGLTKQLPVLIDGNVWNDVNSDGLMDEEEERIEGAVVRLVRYWYDETGIGYWEQVPGQTPGGDGSFENSGLTREEYDEIVAMADPFKLDEGETMTSGQRQPRPDRPRGCRDARGGEGRVAPRLDLHPGYAGRPHRSPRSVQGRSGHELSVPAADGRRGPGGCRRRREVLRPERLRVRARRRFR